MTTKINYNQIKGMWLNVLDFGAYNDGTHAAETTAALNLAFASSGYMVYMPAGTYLLNANLAVPACSGIVGESRYSTEIVMGTGVTRGLDIGMPVHYGQRFSDFYIQGNAETGAIGMAIGYSQDGTNAMEISYVTCDRIRVLSCNGTNGVGWYISDVNFSQFNHCSAYYCQKSAYFKTQSAGAAGTTPSDVEMNFFIGYGPTNVNVQIVTGGNITFNQPQFIGMVSNAMLIQLDSSLGASRIEVNKPHIESVVQPTADLTSLYAFYIYSPSVGTVATERANFYLNDCDLGEGTALKAEGGGSDPTKVAKLLYATGNQTFVTIRNLGNSGYALFGTNIVFDNSARGVIEGWGTYTGGPVNATGYRGYETLPGLVLEQNGGVCIGPQMYHTSALATGAGAVVVTGAGTVTLDAASLLCWEREGDQVKVTIQILVASVSGPSGAAYLSNILPFTCNNTGTLIRYYPATVTSQVTVNSVMMQGYCNYNTKHLILQLANGANAGAEFKAGTVLYIHAEYTTNEGAF